MAVLRGEALQKLRRRVIRIRKRDGTQNVGQRLRPGMRIAAFYDANLPTPAVYPPQYRAEIITSLRRGQQVVLGYFDENLTSEDNSLQLNVGPMTNVVTLNGQPYTCSPEGTELLVYYTNTTFSIPAMTTPQKINH